MDGVQTEIFGAKPNVETELEKDVARKKRKLRDRKFIDLQKQPPKPKPLIQE